METSRLEGNLEEIVREKCSIKTVILYRGPVTESRNDSLLYQTLLHNVQITSSCYTKTSLSIIYTGRADPRNLDKLNSSHLVSQDVFTPIFHIIHSSKLLILANPTSSFGSNINLTVYMYKIASEILPKS